MKINRFKDLNDTELRTLHTALGMMTGYNPLTTRQLFLEVEEELKEKSK